MKTYFSIIKTNLGNIYAEATNKNLIKLYWTNKQIKNQKQTKNRILVNLEKQLINYLKGKKIKFNIPLYMKGSVFQKNVWKNLQKLNWGEKKSYSEISEKISQNKKSARAVGNACSKNPILIVVPCHRVVSSNGKFGGYKEGLNKKKKLLELEKII